MLVCTVFNNIFKKKYMHLEHFKSKEIKMNE